MSALGGDGPGRALLAGDGTPLAGGLPEPVLGRVPGLARSLATPAVVAIAGIQYFLEPFAARDAVLICGAGHIARPTAQIAAMAKAIAASGAEVVTVAIRRVNPEAGQDNILAPIPSRCQLLPNTSGARTAAEAVRIARLARSGGCGNWIKIEVVNDNRYLLPDNQETIEATRILAAEGFIVLPYMSPDLEAARRLAAAGAAAVMGAELALATGALDLWVADFQDIFPSIMDVANCRKTLVVTTSDSCHLPGAHHHGFDHEHLSLDQAERMAGEIVQAGIERFAIRRHVKRFIPNVSVEAEIGFSVENVLEAFGGAEALARHLREGTIAGLVNLVGCSNPKVLYEGTVLAVTDILLAHVP